MSVMNLTDEQKDAILSQDGFVVYEPYLTAIPAYNLNAIQLSILENKNTSASNKDVEELTEAFNTNIEKLAKIIENLEDELTKLRKQSHLSLTYGAELLGGAGTGKWVKTTENGVTYFKQTRSVEGLVIGDDPIVWLNLQGKDITSQQKIVEQWPMVGRIVAETDTITAYCYESTAPTITIPLMIKVIKNSDLQAGDFILPELIAENTEGVDVNG